jgi:hypothetical protein
MEIDIQIGFIQIEIIYVSEFYKVNSIKWFSMGSLHDIQIGFIQIEIIYESEFYKVNSIKWFNYGSIGCCNLDTLWVWQRKKAGGQREDNVYHHNEIRLISHETWPEPRFLTRMVLFGVELK